MRVSTAYFYATKSNLFAYILIYSEPIVLALLILCGVPKALGLEGLWMCIPISQGILAVMAIALMLIAVLRNVKRSSPVLPSGADKEVKSE